MAPRPLDNPSTVVDAQPMDDGPDPLAHLPWDGIDEAEEGLAERDARARLRARILGEEHAAQRIGRFTLLRKLGEGGMGTVHAAYDDQLQREVALKLLHADACADEDAQHRLIREAQAQAKLSHPHLVPVFEVGRFEGQIFLAMELVQGPTMAQWVAEQPHAWRETLAHWLDVARALEIVHDAGLVHRDIKPGNVIVGEDGRARLVDFGLARGQAAVSQSHTSGTAETATEERSRLDEEVTQSKALVGTPAYMAPELWFGARAGPRSDQYSLCVSIYESLVGRRPFGKRGVRAQGSEPPREWLPRGLHRVLVRGLDEAPGRRFGDMRALVAALESIVERRLRRRVLLGVGLVTAVLSGGLVVRAMAPDVEVPGDPCAAMDDDLDAVWNDERRAAVREGLLATKVPTASALGTWVERSVDGIARQWRDARTEACRTHHIEHTLSDDGFEWAIACLDGQRDTLDEILAGAMVVEATQLPRLTTVFETIGVPEECLTPSVVSQDHAPVPASIRPAVESQRALLRKLWVSAMLEGPREYREPAQEARHIADTLGYGPLQAEAALLLGRVMARTADPEARAVLEDAANRAERFSAMSTRHDALRELTRWAVDIGLDHDDARRALARQLAVVGRLGDPARRRADALRLRARVAEIDGELASAESDLREAIALRAQLGPAHIPEQIATWHHLGSLLAGRGRSDEAEEAFETAERLAQGSGLSLLQQELDGGLMRGHAQLLRGITAAEAGTFDEAREWLDDARTEIGRAYGEDSVPMARVHMALSELAGRRGDLEEVLVHAQAADANVRRWLGDDHPLRTHALSAIGTVAFHHGDATTAVSAFDEALRLGESSLPDGSMTLATQRSNLGEALVLTGDGVRARPLLEAALRTMETTLGSSHSTLSYPLHGLAEVAWDAGDLDEARRHAVRALSIRERERDDLPELARTQWLLARVEAESGAPSRARQLAEAARTTFEGLGPSFSRQVDDIEAWTRDPRETP